MPLSASDHEEAHAAWVEHLDSLPAEHQAIVADAVIAVTPDAATHLDKPATDPATGNVKAFNWAALLAAIPQILALFVGLFGKKPPAPPATA